MPDIRKLTIEIYWDNEKEYEDREEKPLENATRLLNRQVCKGLYDVGFWDDRDEGKDWLMTWEIEYDQKWPDIDEDEYFEQGGIK